MPVLQQNLNVLDGRNQIFLDSYSPKPPPSRPVKNIPGASGKGTLHKMLPGFDVSLCLSRSTRLPHLVQLFLPQMTLDRSTRLVLRALFSAVTCGTDLLRSSVISALAVEVKRFRLQMIPRRTTIGVALRIIFKPIFREDLESLFPLCGEFS